MKTIINVKRTGLWLDADVTFAQVRGWYGHSTKDLKMDVIYPFEGQEKNWPCIVWVCGGGWMQMDYHAHLPNLMELARAGFVIASVEYRDSNWVQYPGQLEDIKAAIRYLRAHAEKYQIDPERIGIMGESAGAHLAALAGVTGNVKSLDQGDYLEYNSSVQSVCTWYVPANLVDDRYEEEKYNHLMPLNRLMGKDMKDKPEESSVASPITYVDKDSPPFLLIHGTKDKIVPHEQSELFHEVLTKHGIPSELILIEDAGHGDIRFYQEEIMEKIVAFFQHSM